MAVVIELTLETAKLEKALEELTKESVLSDIAEAQAKVLRQMSEQNIRGGNHRPAEWPPLAESTGKQLSPKRKKSKQGTRPLIDTATMVRAFSVENVTSEGAELHNTQEYAPYHQWGTKKMPARPFVPVTGKYGAEQEPTEVAEKRMQRAGEAAWRKSAKEAGF